MKKKNENNRTVKKILVGTGIVGLGVIGKTVYDYKKDDSDQSIQSWLLDKLFGVFSYPLNQIESERMYEKGIEMIGEQTETSIKVPQLKNIQTSEVYIESMQTLIFNDKNDEDQQVVFFLHGGAYLIQPAFPHFNTVEDLIKKTDAKIVLPIYPKAPNYNYKDAYPKVLEAYLQTVKNTSSPKNITFIGDSAGGGLALGLSSLLAEENYPQPRQLILISPWLDASSENPEMKKFEESDTLLPSQPYFQATGRLWAGGEENIYHPLVSPIYTDQLNALPPISIFVGGDEMLYPDVLRFTSRMQEAEGKIQLYVKEDMVHDYVIFDTPEGEEARNMISARILARE